MRCDVEVFADGFNVAADVGTGDGVGESVVGDGFDGGFEHWCEHFQSALAVDASVLPEFGGDADESGEESTRQDGGCVVSGVGGFAFDGEGVAVVTTGEGLEPRREGFVIAVDGVPNVGEPIGIAVAGEGLEGMETCYACSGVSAASSTERVRAPEQWMT